MVILLVDDQASVLSSLKTGVDWDSLSIQTVYTALNAMEAKEIIASHPIDILLSDIEMPMENGLSLLRWCRKNGYEFECIFLTSHADFFYAQEAIQLGSFDYLLQPARYEDIKRVIRKTIARIQEKQQQQTWLKFGKTAFSKKSAFFKGLLSDWLNGQQANLDAVLSSFNEMKVPLKHQSDVYLLELQIQNWHSLPLSLEEWSQTAEEVFQDFLSHYSHSLMAYCPDKITMTILVYSDGGPLMDFEFFQSRLNMIYTRLSRQLSCSCAFYVLDAANMQELPARLPRIRESRKNNICQNSGIFVCGLPNKPQIVTHCDGELLSKFEMYLIGHQAAKAEREALLYLQTLNAEGRLNHDTLLCFCQDYRYCAYNAARKLELFTHSIPSFETQTEGERPLPITLEQVAAYLKVLTQFFESALSETEASNASLSLVERYIRDNLDKPLLCSEIAKAVYLSPDYISRLFHKEKGMPLKEYITLSKMKAARNMLITTSLPISLIASKVGYDNFSHFSKVYKKVMGTTPSSERNT